MIRLSEAMAKLECCEEVTEKHVKEAYRLLNKSIIRVEQPDIHLDDEDDAELALAMDAEEAATQQNGHGHENGNGENGHDETAPKKKLTLSFDEYRNLSNMLVIHMRNEEARAEEVQAEEAAQSEGIKKSELINWYLEQIADQIESEEELIERKTLIEKVVDRLMYHDQVIIPLKTANLGDKESQEEDPVLVVHPNYVVES